MSLYTQVSVTVNNNTTPVQVIPPGDKVSWLVKPRSTSTGPMLVWVFTGNTPTVVPTNVMELTAGQPLSDSDFNMAFTTDAMQQGVAAVMAGATGASTIDGMWK